MQRMMDDLSKEKDLELESLRSRLDAAMTELEGSEDERGAALRQAEADREEEGERRKRAEAELKEVRGLFLDGRIASPGALFNFRPSASWKSRQSSLRT